MEKEPCVTAVNNKLIMVETCVILWCIKMTMTQLLLNSFHSLSLQWCWWKDWLCIWPVEMISQFVLWSSSAEPAVWIRNATPLGNWRVWSLNKTDSQTRPCFLSPNQWEFQVPVPASDCELTWQWCSSRLTHSNQENSVNFLQDDHYETILGQLKFISINKQKTDEQLILWSCF